MNRYPGVLIQALVLTGTLASGGLLKAAGGNGGPAAGGQGRPVDAEMLEQMDLFREEGMLELMLLMGVAEKYTVEASTAASGGVVSPIRPEVDR